MTALSFFCPCVPPTATHQHKKIIRVGRWTRLGDRPELQQARAMLEEVLLPHQPKDPIRGPVRLELEFTWPWQTSHPKRLRALGHVPRETKPDCSNLAKTIEDRLAALRFIEDDARVVVLIASKWFGDTPGIKVDIEPWRPRVVGDWPARYDVGEHRPSLHGLFSEGQPS